MTDQWLTITGIVSEYGISDRTIRRAVAQEELHAARTSSAPNAKMRFRRTDVERWLGVAPSEVAAQA